jgi:hypothetical protein
VIAIGCKREPLPHLPRLSSIAHAVTYWSQTAVSQSDLQDVVIAGERLVQHRVDKETKEEPRYHEAHGWIDSFRVQSLHKIQKGNAVREGEISLAPLARRV